MAGLAGAAANIRLGDPVNDARQGAPGLPQDIQVEHDVPDDENVYDDKGSVIQIKHGDGSVTISLDGNALDEDEDGAQDGPGEWFENLAVKLAKRDPTTLAGIGDDLIRDIREDEAGRRDWIENLATGIKLLGLTIELPNSSSTDAAPVDGMSRIRHPLLLEAVLRFQANARSELLPTDGPVKIRNDDNEDDTQKDGLADALEADMNHYLTVVASEYYPDTDRMLLKLGIAGMQFKKVYFCPLRQRPVSETVDPEDLIVRADATDLRNAGRVTHRSYMSKSLVRRMQLLGHFRDVDLGTPMPRQEDALKQEQNAQQGIRPSTTRPEDRDREIYECYCELDIPGFEHRYKGKISHLPVPYRVTIDVSSREVLSIVRNYKEETKEMPEAMMRFVKYTFVPGLGFYDIGLLNILGNATNAVTAAWRELLDAGMFSNFPGFLIAQNGARQKTNILRVPPGAGVPIDTGGVPIKDAVAPLPYQQPSMALMQLVQNITETGQRVGGTAELQVGEGTANMPVGTILAMIEQATKMLNSVHKRMHASQAEEFRLLAEVFRDHPESFWQRRRKKAYSWDEATFRRALDNHLLTPQADPNTASHSQRILKVFALKQLQSQAPQLYDPIAVDTAAVQSIGYHDPKQFFAPPQAQAAPPPQLQEMEAKMKVEDAKAQATVTTANAKAQEVQAKIHGLGAYAPQAPEAAQPNQGPQGDTQSDLMDAKAKLMDAETRRKQLGLKAQEMKVEDGNRDDDRDSREKLALMGMAKEILEHQQDSAQQALQETEEFEQGLGVGARPEPGPRDAG